MRRLILALLGSAAAAGCQPVPSAPPPPPTAPATPPSAEAAAVAAGNNRFAFDLYGRLAAKPGNVFFSPFSAHAALGMTAAGARGDTLAEMRAVLHLPDDADAGFADLLGRLNGGADRGYELRTANAVWAQKGYPWRPEFRGRLDRAFGTGAFREADFRADPDAERGRINAWAADQTRDRIKDLIAQGRITTDYRMVLANAVYFKGEWDTRFKPEATREAPFTRADGSTKPVPMMFRGDAPLRLMGTPELSVAEIAYKGGEVGMVVVLPAKPDGLPAVEKTLTPAVVDGWLGKARDMHDVTLGLPKFRLETEYDLKPPLEALGMPRAFDPGRADFAGMHSGPERLFIGLVVQKAFAEVNEEGTEAAAATAVGIKAASAPPSFVANRPFVFLIRHRPTGAILFAGRYAGP